MKSPRRLTLSDQTVNAHQLSLVPPPPDSIFWKMWNACTSLAEEALQTPFIQGIKAGTLDPIRYGAFNVNDAYYCYHSAPDYVDAERRTDHPTLRMFLREKYNSYQKYNATFPGTWRVKDATSIIPFDACHQYSEFETSIASKEDPIYCLVVMLPCEYLWAWLAVKLSPPSAQNLYASWVKGNLEPDAGYAIGNFLDLYQKENPGTLDEQKAIQIYTQATAFEVKNFEAALS
jgi:thiaminase/transcriptional activator TenA